MKVKDDPLLNANLSDICIATSAAPTFLPAHYFKVQVDQEKKLEREYNLIDGGVAANNPVYIHILFLYVKLRYYKKKLYTVNMFDKAS